MIEAYFAEVEAIIKSFPHADSYSLKKKFYNKTFGYIGGSIIFENGHRLDFMEAKQIEPDSKTKYRYHYMNADDTMIFRYDNSQHHSHLDNFPHHKHTTTQIIASTEPTLQDILLEIAKMMRKSK